MSGDVHLVSHLCANGANVIGADEHGRTPLHSAAQYKRPDVVRVLCEHGADPNQYNSVGLTPLHVGTLLRLNTVVRVLCEHGAEVGKPTVLGTTPACIAAEDGDTKVLQELCAFGADVDQADAEGHTPMDIAANNGHADFVDALIQRGANPNRPSGCTALLRAARHGHAKIVRTLCVYGADVGGPSSDESPLTELLKFIVYPIVWNRLFPRELDDLCDVVMLLMLAGIRPLKTDLQMMSSPMLRSLLPQELMTVTCSRPASLRHLTKLTIRAATTKPLALHVPLLGLPQCMQKYVLLQTV